MRAHDLLHWRSIPTQWERSIQPSPLEFPVRTNKLVIATKPFEIITEIGNNLASETVYNFMIPQASGNKCH
jgi:hypothetical protein